MFRFFTTGKRSTDADLNLQATNFSATASVFCLILCRRSQKFTDFFFRLQMLEELLVSGKASGFKQIPGHQKVGVTHVAQFQTDSKHTTICLSYIRRLISS